MDERDVEGTEVGIEEHVLDGNALAGSLMDIFGSEMTATPGRCVHCGATNVIARLDAYVRGPGIVLRCPVCHGVVIRMVETPNATYLDVRGAAYLRFERR